VNDRQQNVLSVLRERSLRLAGLYETALTTLHTPAEVGYESVRVSVICHCMRELMLSLQNVLIDNPIERVRPSSTDLAKTLPQVVERHRELDLGADQELVPVPKAVAQAVGSLVATAIKEDGRNRANAAALVTGGESRSHPAVKEWLDLYNKFFVSWAHVDSHDGRDLPTDAELLARMKIVEDVIDVRTTDFFPNLAVVEELLATINEPLGEDV
jgi:hypothetical protein